MIALTVSLMPAKKMASSLTRIEPWSLTPSDQKLSNRNVCNQLLYFLNLGLVPL